MKKLWQKGDIQENNLAEKVEQFTVGNDRNLDVLLAKFDVLGSLAHTKMLAEVGLLLKEDLAPIQTELKNIYQTIETGNFSIAEDSEDIHSEVEFQLTQKLGDLGKKIHSGRSRNDQVLVDLKLFMRDRIGELADKTNRLAGEFLARSNQYKEILMPGYSHLQVAMPSSFGLWFGAWAESLADDLLFLQGAFRIVNQNPLGSAAGYGSSFPLDRTMTTRLLGFEDLSYNVVYAQMGRGKSERVVSFALANLAATLSKFAFDVCLYMSQNFNFVSLPDELTTGSSIMPHKKNPDVFELIRGKCNKIQGLPYQLTLISNNLPSGYFRDLQVMKEVLLPAFGELGECLDMALYALQNIRVNPSILDDKKYDYLFTVEAVNRLVLAGMPFRDAYREVGRQVTEGEFFPVKTVEHTHEGSIGNLCLEEITRKKEEAFAGFRFEQSRLAIYKLLNYPLPAS
ncbi:MAG TPA: argininosuccinate lyase [Prolixibacteraceae bacterium]|nr:argininosuccinate lyase [Prolixibacteraceae bacterium]